ncbi:ER to Golgi transport-related protein [Kockovaella imperatae]|uniref:PRA1 family protein n=1 Tax=Kockovaella imperatae TaxID=4999 RepID=A0A1Y1UMY0_9TREE|nr:ER to Golgi transport-related protein [Kockovaella imperatae]ORX39410.1 ER to Golgi transport-related protein [Kockovaella imperatae]
MEYINKVTDVARNFRETRLSTLKPPQEFFDHHQLSRPKDLNDATARITYNTRHFSGNYLIVILILFVYALLTNYLLIIAVVFLAGGFALINRFAAEPIHIGNLVITQQQLYIGLFVVGLPLLWVASPVSTFFWLVGSSAILIIGHACLMEPGVESEYAGVEGV